MTLRSPVVPHGDPAGTVPAVHVSSLEHRFGERAALVAVDLEVKVGEIFAVLGPNGGGKTTLFRLLSTSMPIQSGRIDVLGNELPAKRRTVREKIAVVFQKPSLDPKLTVLENLRHHGWLYGLSGPALTAASRDGLDRLGLADRAKDLVETLSGGLQRRVELAKALMTKPEMLILDEPSTGLDPGARHDLWRYLTRLRSDDGTTILLTTHLMDEAERSDRIAILDRGRIVALGTPEELRSRIGGDIVTIHSPKAASVAMEVERLAGHRPTITGDILRIETEQGHELISRILSTMATDITSLGIAKPTLEDVFVRETGHRFWNEE